MGGIARWNPWHELEAFWGPMGPWLHPAHPPVEVFERDGHVVVRADVPGLTPANLDVRVEPDSVTIRGGVRAEEEREEGGYFRSERRYGAFRRVVLLPARVEPAKARATYRHGVLEVVAPRLPDDQSGGRRVEVRSEEA